MAQSKITLTFNKGVMRDLPPGLIPEGYASDLRHIYFEDGIARKMPGYLSYYATADANPVNGLFTFTAPNGIIYVMSGTKINMSKIVNGTKTPLKDDYTGYDTETASYDATPWTFAPFGSHILFTNGIDPVQKFIPDYSAVAPIGGSPPLARVVRIFQRHAFLLGMPSYPTEVKWSDIDNYEMWTPAEDNEAGGIPLYESKTYVVGAEGLGDLLVVYTGDQVHVFQYTGGTYIFSRRVADWKTGLWKKHLVATGEGIQAFMSKENFYSFDGTRVSPIGDPINKEVFAALHTGQMSRAFAFPVKSRSEIWFCVPLATGSGWPELACIWNYRNGAWSFDDIFGWGAATDKLPTTYPILSPLYQTIYSLGGSENSYGGEAINSYVDSPEFGGDNPEVHKHILKIQPEILSTASTIKFAIWTRDNINTSKTWSGDFSFTPATDLKIDIKNVSGKLWGVRIKSDTLNSPHTIGRIHVWFDDGEQR